MSRLLARMSRESPADAAFSDKVEQRVEQRKGIAGLFEAGLARDTIAIWGAFFMCLLAVYSAFSWLPTMLARLGGIEE